MFMWKKFLKSLKLSESYISMALGLLVVLIIGILIFNFFSGRVKKVGKEGELVPPATTTTEEVLSSLPTSHTVVDGENLWSIAEKYYNSGYNWIDIAKENNLTNPDVVSLGQVLTIPKAEPILAPTASVPSITGDSYTVVHGDNLWEIAVRAYGDGYQWLKIVQANNLANPDLIHPGNVLTIPR